MEVNPGGISFALVSLVINRRVNFIFTKHCSNFRAFLAIFCLTCLVINWTKAYLVWWRTKKIVSTGDRRSRCVHCYGRRKVSHSATSAWLVNTSAMQKCSGTEELVPTREDRGLGFCCSPMSLYPVSEGPGESCWVLGLPTSIVQDRPCPDEAGSHMGIDQVIEPADFKLLVDRKACTSTVVFSLLFHKCVPREEQHVVNSKKGEVGKIKVF